MNSISFSQFSTYSECPYKWKLLYIDKLKEYAPGIDGILGTALHETLQTYLDSLYNGGKGAALDLDLEKLLYERLVATITSIENEQNIPPSDYVTKERLYEYYEDGVKILNYFLKYRQKYFTKPGYELIGCEVKLDTPIIDNLKFIGYIDVVIKETATGNIYLYDFKKSYMGWKPKTSTNPIKRAQLQLYKLFYSRQFNVPLDKIFIEFIILKQKIFEGGDFPASRIQRINPPASKRTIDTTEKLFLKFINESFNEDGSYNTARNYNKYPSAHNCKFCPFKEKPELCDRKKSK